MSAKPLPPIEQAALSESEFYNDYIGCNCRSAVLATNLDFFRQDPQKPRRIVHLHQTRRLHRSELALADYSLIRKDTAADRNESNGSPATFLCQRGRNHSQMTKLRLYPGQDIESRAKYMVIRPHHPRHADRAVRQASRGLRSLTFVFLVLQPLTRGDISTRVCSPFDQKQLLVKTRTATRKETSGMEQPYRQAPKQPHIKLSYS